MYNSNQYEISNDFTYGEKPKILDNSPSNKYPKIVINQGSGSISDSVNIATNINLVKKQMPKKPDHPKIIMGSQYTYIDTPLPRPDVQSLSKPEDPMSLVKNNYKQYEYTQDLKNMNVPSSYLANTAQASLIFYEDGTSITNNNELVNLSLESIKKYYDTHGNAGISGVYGKSPTAYDPNNPNPDNVSLYNSYNQSPTAYSYANSQVNPSNKNYQLNNANLSNSQQVSYGNANIYKSSTSINPLTSTNSGLYVGKS